VRNGACFLGAIIAALAASGILASVATGDSCAITISWNGATYTSAEARFAVLEPADALGEARIPDCTADGRCAPPEDTVAAFEIAEVPSEAAVLAPDYYGLFVAARTFPEPPEHPLHEAVYGLATRPSFRADCGAAFVFEGTVTQVDPIRIDVERTEVDVEEDDEHARLEIDSGTRIDGFDREGIATLAPGDELVVTARLCQGELAGPLADSIEPAG
jgi:hypothetical protein